MKKIIIALFSLCALYSCETAEETTTAAGTDSVSKLSVSPTSISIDADGGEKTITITSDTSWEMSVDYEDSSNSGWVSLSSENGSESATVTIAISENTEKTARTAYVYVSYSNGYSTITITQEAAPNITLSEISATNIPEEDEWIIDGDSGLSNLVDALESVQNEGRDVSVILTELTEIPDNTFKDNLGVTSISVPSLTSLGANAFDGCSNLQYISIGDVGDVVKSVSTLTISEDAFSGAPIENITLASSYGVSVDGNIWVINDTPFGTFKVVNATVWTATKINFSVAVDDSEFDLNYSFGLYKYNSDNLLVDENYQYYVDGGVSSGVQTIDVSNTQNTIYLPAYGVSNIYSYAPYQSSVSDGIYKIDLSDQSVESSVDLLRAESLQVGSSTSSVKLEYTHSLSKLSTVITAGDGYNDSDLEGMSVKVTNRNSVADFDIIGNSIYNAGSPIDITMNYNSDDAAYSAILLPESTITDARLLITLLNGTVFSTEIPSFDLTAGKEYSASISVTVKGILFSGATIKDWVTTTYEASAEEL